MREMTYECQQCKILVTKEVQAGRIPKFCSNSCTAIFRFRGQPKSEAWKKAASKSKIGNKNPMWKDENVGLSALHEWVKNRLVKPDLCDECKKVPPYDLANISQNYLRDLSDWEWLCRKCHMTKDGRLEEFLKNNPSIKQYD